MIDSLNYHIAPPSEFLPRTLSDGIRRTAGEAEGLRDLHERQLAIVREQNWLNMYVPKDYGGLGLSLPEILRIEESLAWADGSTAWVVTLCSGAAWFIGFLDPTMRQQIFSERNVCLAGSGAVTGTAKRTSDGYVINGHWRYATGSLHATMFTANCRILAGDTPMYHPDGSPVIGAFLLEPNEVTLHKTWQSMGMVATGTHAMEVRDVTVPLNRAFTISPAQTMLQEDIFQFPFLQLAETTLSVNLSGMAFRFLELSEEIITSKMQQTEMALGRVEEAKKNLNSRRQEFYQHADAAWNTLINERIIPAALLETVSQTSLSLARHSRTLVNELYPYCGLTAADTRTEINRVWRNIHTAGQHSLFVGR
jgi:hypothetical protein